MYHSRVLRWAFLAAAVFWAAALPAAVWVAARPTASAFYPFAFGMYAVGSLICHQLPERSFHLWSAQLPVCARCTGIYAGGAIAAIVALMKAALTGTARLEPRPTYNITPVGHRFSGATLFSSARATLIVAAIPTIATLAFEWTTGQMPANWIRALAGSAIGAAVVSAIATDIN